MLRSAFLFHVASGQAFFSGTALIVAAVGMSPWCGRGWLRRVRDLGGLFGVVLVAISATPLPPWAYAALGVLTLVWLLAERRERYRLDALRSHAAAGDSSAAAVSAGARLAINTQPRSIAPWRTVTGARFLVAAAWLGTAAVELQWHAMPRVPRTDRPVLAVLGDSVTAGMGENEAVTWPRRLADKHGVVVDDYSRMGATVQSARQQAAQLRSDHNLVLLEIGGNDLLGSGSPQQFGAGLEQLLEDVCRPGRTVLMFELPLPPSYNRFGSFQRELAGNRRVLLVPKRVLMGVLCRNDTTLDSIHLSQAGHDELADAVWSIVRSAYGPAK